MINFDYDSLNTLAAVVREGTFEAAARSLNVTQSAVSQRIKQLEDRLGGIVVIRGRPCAPTELGNDLYKHIEEVQLLEHQLRRKIEKRSQVYGNRAATIRIAVNSDSLSTWFPDVVRRAADELTINFEITADDQDHTSERLTSGIALAAITSTAVPIQGFRTVSLGSMEYVAIASPEFVEKYFARGVTAQALKTAPAVRFDQKDTLPEKWVELVAGEDVEFGGHLIPSFDGYLESCIRGIGWGLMPTATVKKLILSGKLELLAPDTSVYIPLHWQSSTMSSEILKQLASIVTEEAKKQLVQT